MLTHSLLDLADSLEAEAKSIRSETQTPRGLGFAAGLVEAAERIRRTIDSSATENAWGDWGEV